MRPRGQDQTNDTWKGLSDMSVAIPLADRIKALKESMEEADKAVEQWSESKKKCADATMQPRRLASYYESELCKSQ